MLIPGACLLPFKLAGVWALAHGHPLLGLGIFVMAKMTGTALAAYLFDVVRDKARELAWFDALYRWVMEMLRRAHAWLEAQTTYRAVRRAVAVGLGRLRALGTQDGRRSTWARRLRAAKHRSTHWFK